MTTTISRLYDNYSDAERAVARLESAGVGPRKRSLVALGRLLREGREPFQELAAEGGVQTIEGIVGKRRHQALRELGAES